MSESALLRFVRLCMVLFHGVCGSWCEFVTEARLAGGRCLSHPFSGHKASTRLFFRSKLEVPKH